MFGELFVWAPTREEAINRTLRETAWRVSRPRLHRGWRHCFGLSAAEGRTDTSAGEDCEHGDGGGHAPTASRPQKFLHACDALQDG